MNTENVTELESSEIIPHHPLGYRWKEAYLSIWGAEPKKTWEDISQADKLKVMNKLSRWKEENDKALAEQQRTGVIFDTDTPDIFIYDWLYSTNLLKDLAIDKEMESLFKYNGKNWELIEYKAFEHFISENCLRSTMVNGYNNGKVKSISDMVHKGLPVLPEPKHGFISFENTTVEVTTEGKIHTHQHSKHHGLMATANYSYDMALNECPNFLKWLEHSSEGELEEETEERRRIILAALYFVATNQYRWQCFIEIVGEGGSGKSIALQICKILAGGDSNAVTIDIDALEGKQGKGAYANIIGKRLILCPDQETTIGELAMTKRITGNDPISIPRMHKSDINLPLLPAVMVITANQPLTATDRSSGVFRRRVSILMNNVVKEEDKDIHLSEKLEMEAAAILNYVIGSFKTPQDAYEVLKKATNGRDKIKAMLATEPLTQWIVECLKPVPDGRAQIGSKIGLDQAKKGGQTNTAKQLLMEAEATLYPNYVIWCEANGINKPLSLPKFPDALEAKIKQLSSLDFIPLNKIKPQRKSTFVNIEINKQSSFLEELREAADNYCKFEDERY